MGYNSDAIFIRLAAAGSQNREIPPKFDLTAVQGHQRLSILHGVNRKRICDFLLVTNSNFGLDVSPTVFEILTLKKLENS